jgi:hypothetical protein
MQLKQPQTSATPRRVSLLQCHTRNPPTEKGHGMRQAAALHLPVERERQTPWTHSQRATVGVHVPLSTLRT